MSYRSGFPPAGSAAHASTARRLYRGGAGGSGGPSYDADAEAWFDAVSWGNDELARKQAFSDFVLMGKDSGWWAKQDRLWVLANRDSTAALTCLKSRTVMMVVNASVLTPWQGYSFNGSTQHLVTGFAATDGVNYLQDSGTIGADATAVGSGVETLIGARAVSGSAPQSFLIYSGANIIGAVNGSGGAPASVAHGGRSGLWQVSRNAAAGANSSVVYKNGIALGGGAETSMTPNSTVFTIAGMSDAGTVVAHFNGSVHLAYIGGLLNSTETAHLKLARDALKIAVGY